MNKKTIAKMALTVAATTPIFSFAATVGTILTDIQTILNTVIPILMILATVVFLWGVINYIIWGLLGLFAMVAVWGLDRALVNTFGVGSTGVPGGPGTF